MKKEFPENSGFLDEIAKYGFSGQWIRVLQEIRSQDEWEWPLSEEDWEALPSNYRSLSADERELAFLAHALSKQATGSPEVVATRKMGRMRQKELIGKIGRQRVLEFLGEDKLNRIEESE